MRNCILISNKKDPDLVALYNKVGGQEFANLMKDALRSIVRGGYEGKSKLPKGMLLQNNKDYKDVRFVLTITSEKDSDVRELLSHVSDRKLGQFAKQALRFYLGPAVVLSGYLDNAFSQTLEERSTPVQVFALGEIKSEGKRREKKQIKRAHVPKKPAKKEALPYTGYSTSTYMENTPAHVEIPYAEQIDEISILPQNDISNTGSEEDEVLAMLEGLLM